MGVTMRSTVRNAARLAVYDEMRMSVKNHQTEPTMRPEMDRGEISQPCCMNAPSTNQNEFEMLNSLTAGWAICADTGPPTSSACDRGRKRGKRKNQPTGNVSLKWIENPVFRFTHR